MQWKDDGCGGAATYAGAYAQPSRQRSVDISHASRYTCSVIKTFADKRTRDLFLEGTAARVPAGIARRAARKLEYVDLATTLADLKVPPGNRLHALKDDRKGQHSISVNDQWRICFRLSDGDAYDVEFCDYH